MNFRLKPFEDGPHTVFDLKCSLQVSSCEIKITYDVIGDTSQISWGADPSPFSKRGTDLWKKTCFEFFIASKGDPQYFEFNFSPANEWDFFAFDDYRKNSQSPSLQDLSFSTYQEARRLEPRLFSMTQRIIPCHGTALQSCVSSRPFEFQLSGILQTQDKGPLYFALSHPAGKPDFHTRGCFKEL